MTIEDPRNPEILDAGARQDNAIAVNLAGLNAVPVVGGVIATMISGLVPRKKQERIVTRIKW